MPARKFLSLRSTPATDHIFDLEAALLVEGHVADAAGFGSAQIIAAGIAGPDAAPGHKRRCGVPASAANACCLPVAGFDDEVEDQSASAGGQIEFVAVVDVAAAFDDDVGMRLEEAHQLLASRHRLAGQDPPFGLADDPVDQQLIVAELGLPQFAGRASRQGQLFTRLLQITQGRARDLEQFAVVLDPFGAAAGIRSLEPASLPRGGGRAMGWRYPVPRPAATAAPSPGQRPIIGYCRSAHGSVRR